MKKKTSDVIATAVTFEDSPQKHALKILFDDDDAPEMTSIGYHALPGTNRYISYVITSKGREILKIEVSEPDLRAIAEDAAKMNFVNCFMQPEYE